jgi:hypothetical protein
VSDCIALRPRPPIKRSEWMEMCRAYDYRCTYCRRRVAKLVVEHVEPMSRGGENCRSNIVPACSGCNASKRSLFLLEWVWHQEGLLGRRRDELMPFVAPDPEPRPERRRRQYVVREGECSTRNHRVPAFGETKWLTEWAKDARCRVRYGTLLVRLMIGWHPETAITQPANPKRRATAA